MWIVVCLAIGWIVFNVISIKRGFTFVELLLMSKNGIKGASKVLLILAMVGVLTAMWRASGTIAYIVTLSVNLIHPNFLLISIFLLNALVSFLIGTSFGTVATMGVVCMIIANAAGINPMFTGGAIMSGIFYGDRCSPVSSSAMLVADVTDTDLYDNIKNMFQSAMVPTLIASVIYLLIGFKLSSGVGPIEVGNLFHDEFVMTPVLVLPAVVVLGLSLLRVNVRTNMLLSSLTAFALSLLIQHQSVLELIKSMVLGFHAIDPDAARLINGGGLSSLVKVLCIVCISSTYAGIFKGTGIEAILEGWVGRVREKTGRMGCIVLVSTIISMIACNQTIAILMTAQFCKSMYPDEKPRLANDIEDSTVIIPAMIPWCIAASVPLTTVNAPMTSLFFACYLYILLIWRLLTSRKYK